MKKEVKRINQHDNMGVEILIKAINNMTILKEKSVAVNRINRILAACDLLPKTSKRTLEFGTLLEKCYKELEECNTKYAIERVKPSKEELAYAIKFSKNLSFMKKNKLSEFTLIFGYDLYRNGYVHNIEGDNFKAFAANFAKFGDK